MSAANWTARITSVEENESDQVLTVAMGEDSDGGGRNLIIQCSLEPPDVQQTGLGLDTYCLMNEEGAVQYGGVTAARLHKNRLTLSLDAAAAEELGLGSRADDLRISLKVGEDAVRRLADGLRRVLTYGNPAQRPQSLELETA